MVVEDEQLAVSPQGGDDPDRPAVEIVEPEDIAGAVSFLCSPDAAMICGQTLVVDGGYSLPA